MNYHEERKITYVKVLDENNNFALASEGSKVEITNPLTAFGEMKVANLTPIIQLSFVYGISSQQATTTTTASGTVTTSNSLVSVSSGASGSSSAVLNSKRYCKYRTGQGIYFRGTAIFDTPAEGNTQLLGIGTSQDGLFFGYNGTSFGILHRNNSVDTWHLQSTWNVDKMDGLNPQMGNVYSISMQWLGFGELKMHIEDSETGKLTLVHRIKYANSNTTPSLKQPSLPIRVSSENTSNTSDIVVQTASLSGFIEGMRAGLGSTYAVESTAITGVTSEVPVLSVRVNTQINSIDAYVPVFPLEISMFGEGTTGKPIKFNIYLNGSLTTPSWTNINASECVIAYDVTSTSFSGGKKLGTYLLERNRSLQINFKEQNLELYTGDILTITCSSASSFDPSVSMVLLQEDSG